MDRFCEDIYNCERYIFIDEWVEVSCSYLLQIYLMQRILNFQANEFECAKIYICYARLIILLCKLFYLKES